MDRIIKSYLAVKMNLRSALDRIYAVYYTDQALSRLKRVKMEVEGILWVGRDMTVLSTLIEKESGEFDTFFSYVFICSTPEGRYAKVTIDEFGAAKVVALNKREASELWAQKHPVQAVAGNPTVQQFPIR